MIGLSTSTYYFKPKRSRLDRDKDDAILRDKIEQIQIEFPRSGYRTMRHYLKRAGVKVGETRLRRVMKEHNLQAKIKRKFIKTTDSRHSNEVYPNLLPEMGVDNINQVWVTDITYIRILNGFVFLAAILDVYSRKVIGWAISKSIDHQLTMDALQMAIVKRSPPRGIIHHSDRGVQYLCKEYVSKLIAYGFHMSCSRKGNPYDNAFAESFFKTLKSNEVDLKHFETIVDVLENVPRFIEEVYNEKRVHSALSYKTPNELEKEIELEQKQNTKTNRPVLKL
jgi:transposase InsO family protein